VQVLPEVLSNALGNRQPRMRLTRTPPPNYLAVRSKDRDHHRALKLRAGEFKALIWDFRLRAGSIKFLIRVFNSKQERLLGAAHGFDTALLPARHKANDRLSSAAKSRRRVETSATAFQKDGRDTQPVRQYRRIL
jgi:hypothetical protein